MKYKDIPNDDVLRADVGDIIIYENIFIDVLYLITRPPYTVRFGDGAGRWAWYFDGVRYTICDIGNKESPRLNRCGKYMVRGQRLTREFKRL